MTTGNLGNLQSLLQRGLIGAIDNRPFHFAAEASTLFGNLGLPRMEFPAYLKVFAHGREITMVRAAAETNDGDLLSVTYDACGNGILNLRIFND